MLSVSFFYGVGSGNAFVMIRVVMHRKFDELTKGVMIHSIFSKRHPSDTKRRVAG
jgi:hypothetical protein